MPEMGTNMAKYDAQIELSPGLKMSSHFGFESSSSESSELDDSKKRKKENEDEDISFCVDDIESLQDAEIDNRLLEFHFLSPSK